MTYRAAEAAREFTRPVPAPKDGSSLSITETASEKERAALARRFGVPAVESLALTASLTATAGEVRLRGVVSARLVQNCVVTLEPMQTRLDEPFERRFLPAHRIDPTEEFDPDADDPPEPLTDFIDVGEIAAETAALAIDPYPRSDDIATDRLSAAPPGAEPLDDDALKPFAGLAALKKRLEEGEGGNGSDN